VTEEFAQIEAACHCGNIRFSLRWPGPVADITVRRCGCTFCQERDGAWTSHPQAELVAEINDMATVSKYRFGTRTADFYVCSICGVVPFVVSEIDDHLYAVVNVKSFENIDSASLSSAPTNFDGEDTGDRLERRRQNWISNVRISASVANNVD